MRSNSLFTDVKSWTLGAPRIDGIIDPLISNDELNQLEFFCNFVVNKMCSTVKDKIVRLYYIKLVG